RGTGAARELREVVRLVQPLERVAPAALVDEVVPLRDQVVHGTAVLGLAERHAAVHAARALDLQVLLGGLREDLFEIADALARVPIRNALLRVLQKAVGLAHNKKSSNPINGFARTRRSLGHARRTPSP